MEYLEMTMEELIKFIDSYDKDEEDSSNDSNEA